ncbi:unnamed protein product [Cylindrotheca closterium]|uniref:Ribosomal RNA large subunit methyltransferase K/L-like methyltransferase domain-containing protein n=1 Tax=Cylindrotheca closterium TaxID=2856 RepID=A0AAD2GC98_9STRA|nr:unnamed protein product [Cylindrotheca closterium]
MEVEQEHITVDDCYKYLAMIPRGLHQSIASSLLKNMNPDTRIEYLGEEEGDGILTQTLDKLQEKNTNNIQKVKANRASMDWFHRPVGTIPLHSKFHVSLGYTSNGKSSWTCPGQVSGSMWMMVQTRRRQLMTSRCIGPLLSTIVHGKIFERQEPVLSKSEMVSRIGDWSTKPPSNEESSSSTDKSSYRRNFDRALNLWKEHVKRIWKSRMPQQAYNELMERIETNKLRFRMSNVRENADLPYTRTEFLQSLMEDYGDTLIPYYDDWKVDLTNFDVEVLVVVMANGAFSLGISLQPYSSHGSKSFAIGGVPPDVTPPYIGGDVLSGVVRLRPTTAHLMLELAELKPYEMVLDPCAGIGTIPVEAEHYYWNKQQHQHRAIGIGGDIVVNHESICSAAFALENIARQQDVEADDNKNKNFSRLSVAWDAALLPLRSGIVDAVVSDLPFGKMCLSASAVEQLLPLVMVQCARVLVPKTGRMVLLCGSPDAVLRALERCPQYWKQPCTMVAPVNIGGLLAWMLRVERSDAVFDETESKSSTRNLEKIRGMTKKRDNRRKHSSKKRRIQSKS